MTYHRPVTRWRCTGCHASMATALRAWLHFCWCRSVIGLEWMLEPWRG